MRVLLVGGGGREHAMAWKLSRSPLLTELLIAPGNAGTASLGENLEVAADDIGGLLQAAKDREVELTIVGPEAPLVGGLVDTFEASGLQAFGPTAAAALIEGSKVFAKDLMRRHGIPTARAEAFDRLPPAEAYLDQMPGNGAVIKADGLAAGKGVVVTRDRGAAKEALRGMLAGRSLGDAGSTVVIEDLLEGPELSVFAFVDGRHVSSEIAACDYKRAGDGDSGPNTGGMGAYSPPEFWTPELAAAIRADVMEAAAQAMAAEGCPYTGVLYAGLMLCADGPMVIEFNCRLGDPEAQVVLPRLESDLLEVCRAATAGRLAQSEVRWGGPARAAVVMASGGYPGKYETGHAIDGLDAASEHALVFHAGTAAGPRRGAVTAGGRVLAVVGEGPDLGTARDAAYAGVGEISFTGARYRRDIGARAVSRTRPKPALGRP